MPKKRDNEKLESILRRRGAQQTANVRESVTEIRSCGVCGDPEPIPPNLKERLHPLMIIWDYSVQHAHQQTFHNMLKQIEPVLFSGMPQDSFYLGTYMLCAGGTPQYRTLWAYQSVEQMMAVWASMSQPVLDAVIALRQYWLMDPNKSEGRWVPAQCMYTGKKGNPFAWLTMKAAKMALPKP